MSVISTSDSWFYRQIRKLQSVLKIIIKAKKFQYEQLNDRGIDEGTKLSVGTQGFGFIGERVPVSKTNLDAYVRMILREKAWFRDLDENDSDVKEAKEIFNMLTRGVEVDMIARSHTEKSILGVLADAFGDFVEKIERTYDIEEAEKGEETND